MRFALSGLAITAAVTVVSAAVPHSPSATKPYFPKSHHYGPEGGDVTDQRTMYELYTFSEAGFDGEAVRMEPYQCLSTKRYNVTVNSIYFTGNNCCYFFPKNDCSNLLAGNRVVGNVHDVSAWGFHKVKAIKCLSSSACGVIEHSMCDLDPSCDRKEEQGMCPFVSSCKNYSPVHPGDWVKYESQPELHSDGSRHVVNPIKERYIVEDADDWRSHSLPDGSKGRKKPQLTHHGDDLHKTGHSVSPLNEHPQVANGGHDNYDVPWYGRPVMPASNKDRKKADKAAKKADKLADKEAEDRDQLYDDIVEEHERLVNAYDDYIDEYGDDYGDDY